MIPVILHPFSPFVEVLVGWPTVGLAHCFSAAAVHPVEARLEAIKARLYEGPLCCSGFDLPQQLHRCLGGL